jgi:hypothetical protein
MEKSRSKAECCIKKRNSENCITHIPSFSFPPENFFFCSSLYYVYTTRIVMLKTKHRSKSKTRDLNFHEFPFLCADQYFPRGFSFPLHHCMLFLVYKKEREKYKKRQRQSKAKMIQQKTFKLSYIYVYQV